MLRVTCFIRKKNQKGTKEFLVTHAFPGLSPIFGKSAFFFCRHFNEVLPFLQRFIMILSEHLVRCDTDGVDFKTPWYIWTIGRLQQIFLMVQKYGIILFKVIEKYYFSISSSITSKWKSTAPRWKPCFSPKTLIRISWTSSNSFWLSECKKIRRDPKTFRCVNEFPRTCVCSKMLRNKNTLIQT